MLAAAVALALATDPSVQLAALANRYRDYDLPLPPKDAKLYRLTWHRPDNPPGHQEWMEVGFALTINSLGKPEKVLKGLDEEAWYAGDNYTEAELTASNWPGRTSRDHWSEWMVAAQCEAVGQHELAMTAWSAFTKSGRDQAHASAFLAKKAWAWWVEQFHLSADRAKVARRLQLIATDCPDAADSDLLRKLKLSLQPTDAKSGSVEARIDELLDAKIHLEYRHDPDRDPRLNAVSRLGFDAVPALIDHLDDDRLTRTHTTPHSINFGARKVYQYSVKHFARDILYGYMACKDAEEHQDKGTLLTKADALAWWTEAKKEGEEAYAIRQVVGHCANEHLLAVIEHKFPKRFPDVFEVVRKLDTSWTDLRPLVSTLVRSSLPTATKTKVLLEATESAELHWKTAALLGLHQVAPGEFHTRLIAVLGDLPIKTGNEPVFHTNIAEVAVLTDDAKVWTAVGKYLESASADEKLGWIFHLVFSAGPEEKSYRRVVGCLAALVADDSVSVRKNGDKVTVLSVRNHTAENLGLMLGLKSEQSDRWTDEDWREFREEVTKAARKVTESKK